LSQSQTDYPLFPEHLLFILLLCLTGTSLFHSRDIGVARTRARSATTSSMKHRHCRSKKIVECLSRDDASHKSVQYPPNTQAELHILPWVLIHAWCRDDQSARESACRQPSRAGATSRASCPLVAGLAPRRCASPVGATFFRHPQSRLPFSRLSILPLVLLVITTNTLCTSSTI
jgi:hypothetical protein